MRLVKFSLQALDCKEQFSTAIALSEVFESLFRGVFLHNLADAHPGNLESLRRLRPAVATAILHDL